MLFKNFLKHGKGNIIQSGSDLVKVSQYVHPFKNINKMRSRVVVHNEAVLGNEVTDIICS